MEQRERPFVAAGVLAALGASAVALQASLPLNHDVGWLLLGARRMLAGARLYVDGFVDVNPPLNLALLAAPAAAAQALGLSEVTALRFFVFALAAVSLWLCSRLGSLLLAGELPELRRGWLLVLAFLLLLTVGYDFGQREHLIALFLLPYLVEAATRLHGVAPARELAAAVGALAGLVIGLKPHYALVVAGVELLVLQARRNPPALPGIELGALALVFAGSLAWTAWIAPDYFRVALPLAREAYGAYQVPLSELVRARDLALLALALLAAAATPRASAPGALARTCSVASVAGYAAYLVGGTHWDYHRYPFETFAFATLPLPLLRLLPRVPARHPGWAIVAFALTAALVLVAPSWLRDVLRTGGEWRAGRTAGKVSEIARVIERRGRGGAIFVFSTTVYPAFPAVNHAGVDWASRFSCLWLLPTVLRELPPVESAAPAALGERTHAIALRLLDAVVEDLERMQPDLIFIPHGRMHQGFEDARFDFLAFIQARPRLARILSHYARWTETPRYHVYARRP